MTDATDPAGTVYCERHPDVETGLRCGRCETPICPRCVVMTDVGARCPTCAPRRQLPQFELSPLFALRGAAAAAASGAIVGLAWGIFLPGGFGGFLIIFLGIGIGYAVAESISAATNRKAGPVLQSMAVAGVILAYVVRGLISDYDIVPSGRFADYGGFIALIAGIVMAFSRLRD
ncbi:MAG TPA: B-box zinc finger protein [Dehalococcoidia bacterium]|nr:B-box zinc finger protein [Dehalococcoidia bacterium]